MKQSVSKEMFINHMNELKGMSNEELILYKKWNELNVECIYSKTDVDKYKGWIWEPTDINNVEQTINEVKELQPYVKVCSSSEESSKWNIIRRMISSFSYTPNPGRIIRSYVLDKKTDKLLGLISLSSDVPSISVRDKWIGWSFDNKWKDKKMNNIGIGTTIVPTQPLGFNFLGGKLISTLITSPILRSEWKKRYNDTLVCISTTSLYGIQSQYNGIPHFKTLGETKGMMCIVPDKKYYQPFMNIIKDSEWYQTKIEGKRMKGKKQSILDKVFKFVEVKRKDYITEHCRGVYSSMMYENGKDFLCGKIGENELRIGDRYKKGDEYSIQWWMEKGINRYRKMVMDNRIKSETLWYSDIIGMSWEQCKQKYLSDIGR